jgi:hypothetical protein
VRGSDTGLTGPRFFDSLDLAGSGLLSFQGLSRGDDLLTVAYDSPGRAQP